MSSPSPDNLNAPAVSSDSLDTPAPRRRQGSPALWALLVLIALLGLTAERWPLSDASARLSRFSEFGSGYASRPIRATPAERAVFGGARIEKRLLACAEGQYLVTIIDGTQNRHALHDPQYCFRGAGWRIARREDVPLPGGGAACRAALEQTGRTTEALYWFSDGKERHASPVRCWWEATLRRLTFGRSGGAPVLVLVQPARVNSSVIPGNNTAVPWRKVLDSVPPLQQL